MKWTHMLFTVRLPLIQLPHTIMQLLVWNQICLPHSPQLCITQTGRDIHPSPPPLHTQPLSPAFAEALKLILPNIAIQLWSRALLQACNDRINGNIIGESYFIHVLLWKGQRATLRENVKIPEQVGDNAMRGIQREAWANNSIICSVKLARSL